MDTVEEPWTSSLVLEGLTAFYRSLQGAGLMFPWADKPVVATPHGTAFAVEKIDMVREAVAALPSISADLANHLFRECWWRANKDLPEIYWGWRRVEWSYRDLLNQPDHNAKVEIAAEIVARRHNLSRRPVDEMIISGSDVPHGRPSDVAVIAPAA